MKIITLTRGREALIDDQDYEELSKFKWHYVPRGKGGYAARGGIRINGKQMTYLMHRQIMDTPKGMETDHINGNKSDNRRQNLRICTGHENIMAYRSKCKNSTSKYRGVSWYKSRRKWYSAIKFNNKGIFIGYFRIERDAAKAYNKKAQELFGEFAQMNAV